MKKSILNRVLWLLIPLLTMFNHSVWGTEATFSWTAGGTMGSNATGKQGNITLTGAANSASNAPGVTSNTLRIYAHRSSGNGASATFTADDGYQITAFTITSSNGGSILKYSVDGGSNTAFSWSNQQSTISNLTATAFTIKNCQNSGNSNTTVQVASVVVTYAATGGGTTYSITYADTNGEGTNGSYSASSTSGISANSEITLSATPANCYQLASWNVYKTGDQSTTITVTNDKFSMPAYDVTVGATFSEKPAGKTVNFDAGAGTYTGGSLTEDCDGAGITLPSATASGICKGWTTFAGWATAAVSDSTTTSVTLYTAGSKYVPATNNMTLYAVYSKTKSGDPVSVVGGDISSGFGTTGLDGSHFDFYSGNGFKFKAVANYVTSGDLSSNNYTALTVKLKAGHNGGSGSVLTIASFDANGDVIDSEDFTPTEAYVSQSTVNTFNLSGSTVIKEIRVTMKTKTNNLGMKYCEVFAGGSTTHYCSDPDCCTALGSINGSITWSHCPIQSLI